MMKKLFLTFDDGPSETTPLLLDVLKQEGVKASFFVTNEYNHPELLDRISDEGHMMCLHSYSHDPSIIYTSIDEYFRDLKMIEELLYSKTGIRAKYHRVMGGTDNTISRRYGGNIMPSIIDALKQKGYFVFDWNCENFDGTQPDLSREKYEEMGIKSISVQSQAVFLSHTRPTDRESILSLPAIINWSRKNGYEFGLLSEYSGKEILNINTRCRNKNTL